MKIKQVEELVGITSKNIRFYEDQGLLSPDRAENGYRDYSLSDVERLKKIKLLRKLDIPVEQIKRALDGQLTLRDCLETSLSSLETEQQNLNHRKALAEKMMQEAVDLDNLDTENWLDEIEHMEKEGVDFVDVRYVDIHRKKIAGAVGGGIVGILIFVLSIALIIWAKMEDPEFPLWLVWALCVGFGLMALATAVATISRILEIDGGEEDEASKY